MHHVLAELADARREFHAAIAALPDQAWGRPSANRGWTNGELLFHATLGFILVRPLVVLIRVFGRLPRSVSRAFAWLLDVSTGPFNRVNALGPRLAARVYDRETIARKYDRVHAALLRKLGRLPPAAWRLGMHYPRRWDPRFPEFMRIEDLVRYTIRHQRHHLGQLVNDRERP